ncbi:MAG: hypothetical protein RIR00_2167 [Pseudomonadota bacterium]
MSRAVAPLVIFAVGNPSRGDDALGPRLAEQLAALPPTPAWELVEDFQLQVEHSLDLCDRQLALFIDAGSGTPAPFSFYPLNPRAAFGPSSHALAPEAVLAVFAQTQQAAPPPAYVLCVRGEDFSLGAPLSPAAETHLAAAWAQLETLLAQPTPAAWAALATAAPDPR